MQAKAEKNCKYVSEEKLNNIDQGGQASNNLDRWPDLRWQNIHHAGANKLAIAE